MFIRRIRYRESCVSEMTCRFNGLFFSNFVSNKNPCSIKPNVVHLKLRSFASFESEEEYESTSHISRISRVARTDAQEALFDYLHCTRGFHFTDADHISKNSPHFLHWLISSVENEQDVSRALPKFFRYNPINEFEPFLESLGLHPSELDSLLPRNLMFLHDDELLLDNFHALCAYGIPRIKIGRMYKEASEIFRYDYGTLSLKLKSYEQLGLHKSTVIKLVACCPPLLIGHLNKDFVGVHEKLTEIGLGNDWIGSYLSGKKTYNWRRMLDLIRFLSVAGYSGLQMRTIFEETPAILFENPGKGTFDLVGRLLKLGLELNSIYKLLLTNPQILSAKFSNNIWDAISFLFDIRMDGKDIVNIVASNTELLGAHTLNRPKTVLRKAKVKKEVLCQMIIDDPLKLLHLASTNHANGFSSSSPTNPSKFLDKTTFLLKIGYLENSDEMMKALKQFRGRGDQLQERFDCLVNAGLDYNLVSSMIRQAPTVLNLSKDVLEKKIDYLINRLGYPLDALVAFPSYLCYDMQRITVRVTMYLWLRERGKAKPMLSLSTILACSDLRFEKYFVNIDPQGPAKWEGLRKLLIS
ncbi:transcription termination factor MTEF18, mitochondrial-like [Impatiens glandulifera]|uniref:transcription termination factor MTEF18, mitochondrial-like n=1 Tax=Impatiens glandulifera TaxID=253017 RepID=UPI001FB0BF37|nr:transcription termination factor MTEF18, mitochondrial-like [Impatiens glandulifera]